MSNSLRTHCIRIIFFIVSVSFLQKASVQEIYTLEQALPVLDLADKNTLVIFDVNDTLIYPTDTVMQSWFAKSPEGKKFYQELELYCATKDNPFEHALMLISKMRLEEKPCPVESQTIPIINMLQTRGIKIVALTNFSTGSAGVISSKQEWRFKKLAQAGINLSNSFEPVEIKLSQCSTPNGHVPLFYKGILITNHASKGCVLGVFLDALHYKPAQILFFDNQKKNIESVQNEAMRRNINFNGFIYKAAAQLNHTYDQAIINLQLNYLIRRDEYITEAHAREQLNIKNIPELQEIFTCTEWCPALRNGLEQSWQKLVMARFGQSIVDNRSSINFLFSIFDTTTRCQDCEHRVVERSF